MADGADVNGGDYDRRTALHLGAAEGHLDVVDFLIAHGADVNAQDRWRGTPLRDAEASDHQNVVELLKRHARARLGDGAARVCHGSRRHVAVMRRCEAWRRRVLETISRGGRRSDTIRL